MLAEGLALSFLLIAAAADGAETYGPDNLPPFVHPPVMAPIPDGIKLEVPEELGNQELARLGFLDVTAAPFRADPTGAKDATDALQRAIEFARDAQMVCFFPAGTYTVSDTLVLRHGIHMRSHKGAFLNNLNMPCVLIGSRRGEGTTGYARPRIVLRDESPGFGDPSKPKFVIEHRLYDVRRFTVRKTASGGGGSLMNTMVVGLDIVIGRGNPGACGMVIRSCEGSAVQDVTIDARHGHTGIVGGTGNGGSWANVTVIGGRIGLDMRGWTPPTPTMVGITLLDQTEAAILESCRGVLTAVGLRIRSATSGPLIVGEARSGPFDSAIALVDSVISFEGTAGERGRRVAITSERSLYLNNVFVRGADDVVPGELPGNREGWLQVKEFAAGKTRSAKGYDLSAPVYVDGRRLPGRYQSIAINIAPPADLQARHLWDQRFPSWESPAAVNVKDPPYNARGDSHADDTAALQQAIDDHEIVFLPKGYYRLTKTLRLRPNTKLIGVAQHLSVIMVRDPEGWFGDAREPRPLIETADDPRAETVVAFVGLRWPREVPDGFAGETLPVYAIKWRCGRRSMFRSAEVNPLRVYGFVGIPHHRQPPMRHAAVLITGNGGGKWYNYHAGHNFMPTTRDSRAILVRGTSEPLGFYNFEPQGGDSTAVAEIRDARYVSLYGCKTECDTTFLRVTDSDHVRVFGHGGIGNPAPGGVLFRIERTPNFLIANIADQAQLGADVPYYGGRCVNRNIETYFPLLVEDRAGPAIRIPPLERPVLFRSGEPQGG